MTLTENKTYKQINYSGKRLSIGEYDNCTFVNCDFSESDISNITFLECEFTDCNFSNVLSKNTSFQEVVFYNCKLLGTKFNDCNDFLLSLQFENCQLNLASFYKLKLKNTSFKDCNLQEVDFTETDLSNSVFNNCDLSRVIFDHTILEKVDFRTATNYVIDPEINRLKKAKFSSDGVIGLLRKYNIEVE